MKVIGYKWLHVSTSVMHPPRLALYSAHDAHEWTRGTNRASYVPSAEDLWGFNAYYGAWRARLSGHRFGTVMVGVAGYGAVALFQHGWRAEMAEIVAIHISRFFWRGVDKGSRPVYVEKLRGAYDVPVVRSLTELRRETERWGVPGKIATRA